VNDDAQLIDQTLAGQAAAFGQLVQKHQDRLFNTVAHLVGNTEDAKDIVQDVFVQAFVKLESFQRSSSFYTWLYRIAFNMSMSSRRKIRPTASVEYTKQTSGVEPIDPLDGPAEQAERHERCQQVQQAIAELSEEHRAILVLREIEGFCYESIAEILDLPVGTVRSRLHRARLQCREQLKSVLIVDT
jgi:RNA polymerase sigma-70 factor, ECF subfamily